MTQDRDREPGISESTRRLIDALGRERQSGDRQFGGRRWMRRWPIGSAFGVFRRADIRDYGDEPDLGWREPSRRYRDGGPPRYLVAAAQAITRRGNVRIWLHGEDARERDRACTWLASFAAAWGWEPVTVPLNRQRRSGYDLRTDRGELFARQLIAAWEYPHEARFDPGGFVLSGPPLAVILRDPGLLTGQRIHLLNQLAKSVRLGADGSLVAICSEAPSDEGIPGFEAVRCESPLSALGRRVADARAKRQITRDDLAAAAGMPAALLAMLESGVEREEISAPGEMEVLIERVASALGVSIGQLLREDEDDA